MSIFDLICVLLAVFLAATSIRKYRHISCIVALEFVFHQIIYLTFKECQSAWVLYVAYAAIQLACVFALKKIESHITILTLIIINLVYNLSTAFGYFYKEFIVFYYVYPYFVGTIMIIELAYMGLLNQYVASYRAERRGCDIDYIDRLFCVFCGICRRGLA